MKKLLLLSALTAAAIAGNSGILTEIPVVQITEKTAPQQLSIYALAGYSATDTDDTHIINDPNLLSNDITDNDGTFGLGLRYAFNDTFFAEAEYHYKSTDFVTNTVLGSINYNYQIDADFSIFAGAIAGHESSKWDSYPILDPDPLTLDDTSDRAVFGGQIGANYTVNEDVYIFAKYQYLTGDDMETTINTNPFFQKNTQNIILGVGYKF